MAQSDFCFTYYDGDAARDKAHMNRLERGAYDDFISAQRKFGHLELKIVKKIFGNDFASVWDALELILKKDAAGKFFIQWLDTSLNKAAQHSEKQRDNANKRWKKKDAIASHSHSNGNATAMPLEDESEDENKKENKTGGVGDKTLTEKLLPPSQAQIEEIFVKHGLTAKEGEEFYRWRNGTQGWDTLRDWRDYTAAVIGKKLNEKKYQNGKPNHTGLKRDARREPTGESFGQL